MPSKTTGCSLSAAGRIAGRRWMATAAWGAAALVTLQVPAANAAGGLADLPPVTPAMDCAAVAGLDLTGVTDAPVTIQSATVETTGAPAPYCAVRGTVAPANTFIMRLPTQGWTQRYLQTGCGGLCGTASINYTQAGACPPVADGTIASATTDMMQRFKSPAQAQRFPSSHAIIYGHFRPRQRLPHLATGNPRPDRGMTLHTRSTPQPIRAHLQPT